MGVTGLPSPVWGGFGQARRDTLRAFGFCAGFEPADIQRCQRPVEREAAPACKVACGGRKTGAGKPRNAGYDLWQLMRWQSFGLWKK